MKMQNFGRITQPCLLLAFTWLVFTGGKAQTPDIHAVQENETVEILYSGDIPEEEMAVRLEHLDELTAHPIPINSGRISELCDLNLITEYQLNKLKEYIFRYGLLLSLNELRYLEAWDEQSWQRVLPYLEPLDGGPAQPLKKPRRTTPGQTLMINGGRAFPESKGYLPQGSAENYGQSHYTGSPWMMSLRYDICMGSKVCAGLRAGKDPGEPMFPYHAEYPVRMHYPDLLSGYLVIRPGKYISSVFLGDYHVKFGRGITLCTAGGFASWKDPFRQGSAKSILRQNTSMSEWGAFRGAALEAAAGMFSGCLFYSLARADPSGHEVHEGRDSFTSFSQSGYHRTTGEIEKRGLLEEKAFGGILLFRGNIIKAGLAACFSRLSMDKVPTRMAYDRYDFTGRRNNTFGGYLESYFRRSSGYLEISWSENNKLAFLASWKSMLSSSMKLTIDLRHFPVAFHPGFHAKGAGPYGSLSNETGVLIGVEVGLPKYWTLALVTDHARIPWISYSNDFPRSRSAFHIRSYKNAREYSVYIAYTYRQGEENSSDEFTMTPATSLRFRQQADMQMTVLHTDSFRYKVRITYVVTGLAEGRKESGSAVQQEVTCAIRKTLKASIGAILCHSDSYDSRVSLYEPALLYSSGSISLYGRGIRAYVLFRWSPGHILDLWIKGGITMYEDVTKVGSGWDETQGNKRFQIQAQLRVRL